MSFVKGLLGTWNPELRVINGWGCYEDLMEVIAKDLKFLHSQGGTEFGLVCEPFKLNGKWVGVVGPDLMVRAGNKLRRGFIKQMKSPEEILEEIGKLTFEARDFDTDQETNVSVLAAGAHDALRWALGMSEGSVSEFLEGGKE